MIGTNIAALMSSSMPVNDSAATPITVKSSPLNRTERPITFGSPPNSSFQKS